MHMSDGLLDLTWVIITWMVTILVLGWAFYKVNKKVPEEKIPLFMVLTAGIFVAQMLNFPIVGGTSGHLVGGTLMAIFMGVPLAVIGMSIILVIQLLFGDGGITALGGNILNMGIIGPISGYLIYKYTKKVIKGKPGHLVGAFIGSWISVTLASLACGIELGLSSIFMYGVEATVPAMLSWHVIIGLGEAIITTIIISITLKLRPDLLEVEAESE